MRILIVDDDEDTRFLISRCLGYLGCCDTAENGQVALEYFQQAGREGKPYGLVTMDYRMPVMDGLEAIRRLRSHESAQGSRWPRSTICLISADREQIQCQVQQMGCDDDLHLLDKPFSVRDLTLIAEQSLGHERALQQESRLVHKERYAYVRPLQTTNWSHA